MEHLIIFVLKLEQLNFVTCSCSYVPNCVDPDRHFEASDQGLLFAQASTQVNMVCIKNAKPLPSHCYLYMLFCNFFLYHTTDMKKNPTFASCFGRNSTWKRSTE